MIYISVTGLQSDRSWQAAYEAGRDAGLDSQVPEGTYSSNIAANKVGNRDFKEFVRQPTLWRQVARLQVPLRAIHGDADIRPIWPVQQLVELVPDASLRIVPDAPHDLWYTHTAQLADLIRTSVWDITRSVRDTQHATSDRN